MNAELQLRMDAELQPLMNTATADERGWVRMNAASARATIHH